MGAAEVNEPYKLGRWLRGRPEHRRSEISEREAAAFARTFEALDIGSFWSTDADGNLTYISPAAHEVLAVGGEIIGQSFYDLFSAPGDDGERGRSLPLVLAKRSRFQRIVACRTTDAGTSWWSFSGEAQFDRSGAFTGFRGHCTDITSERLSAEESSALAMHDALTGLRNRRNMADQLIRTLNAFSVQHRACTVMLIDLDRFKQVNDVFGHPVGDALLKMVASRLVSIIGDDSCIFRIGGDEFQAILPDVEDRGDLGELASRIISGVSQPYTIDGNRCIIGASVGIAISPFDGADKDELLRNADLALYAAKHAGRGAFRFFSGELLKAAEERQVLEEDLHDAVTSGEFELHYQPIVEAGTQMLVGVETLIRWNHKDRGYISPEIFIPIAEETRKIGLIGEWALRKACEDAASWAVPLRVAVNVSPTQFGDEGFPGIVTNALASSGLPADRLELELTESVFLEENRATSENFKVLKRLGVRLVLDDFGTGYSSLSYLRNTPFDKVKIDQTFVRGAIEDNSSDRAIISAVVALAGALGMDTTAEGVETHDQLEMVRDLKVSHIQGYLFSRPIKYDELVAMIGRGDLVIEAHGPAHQRNDRIAMYRKVGAIHNDHYYVVLMRNLSASGALIEGLTDVPVGTQFVMDFGEGQLAVATVRRSSGNQQGVEFETKLVDDGNGGLCTRFRVSPYMMSAAGLPWNINKGGDERSLALTGNTISVPLFAASSDKVSVFCTRKPSA